MNRLRPAWFFGALLAALVAARLCNAGILWAEENLPLAAAAQMLNGRVLYRDAWFDKPPLLPAVYLLWGARAGWLLRVAGALYAWTACWLIWRFARERWGETEGRWAAALLAFFLIFDTHSAVLPLAADLTMLVPHLAAVYLAWRGNALWSGVAAGVAFQINAKGLLVLAACALWSARALPALAAGFLLPNAVVFGWLAATGSLAPYYEQVWKWSGIYAADTFVARPVWNAVVRSANWIGFHAALAVPAAWFWWRERGGDRWRWAAWAALSLAGVTLGWRFFPRYFFQLLPVLALAAARGLTLLGARRVWVLPLLLIPLIRFGPRYVMLASDLAAGRPHEWADVAMDRDSREVAQLVRAMAPPGDTLLVWGFRPELFVYTGLPAATRFLDSQPLTGVAADRHLVESEPLTPEWARAHRAELARSSPAFVLDGLGPYNPRLAITAYEDLREWLGAYREVGRSQFTVIYRRVTVSN